MGRKPDLPSMAPPPQAAPPQPAAPPAALPPHLGLLERFTLLFPVWTLAAVLLSLPFPQLFTWLKGPAIVWALAVIMLGMGLGLQLGDFRRVLARSAFTSPLTALPGAISAVVQAVLGSLLAAWWRSRSGTGSARP
ncbi:hypothetical protein [Synechococcus sp. CS-1328]|uniref:hypothetical protein n=1 Tax=Synechococcus sp. CS-1328 TaxID=2847976 RepID=UPI002880A8AA|nr:hypothetical protein [Synechococcus sp. CS-1328]MCT0224456.1 hypothetical protein [Synechococcus sp. CS-1328]